jgi:hypothetical protein
MRPAVRIEAIELNGRVRLALRSASRRVAVEADPGDGAPAIKTKAPATREAVRRLSHMAR